MAFILPVLPDESLNLSVKTVKGCICIFVNYQNYQYFIDFPQCSDPLQATAHFLVHVPVSQQGLLHISSTLF